MLTPSAVLATVTTFAVALSWLWSVNQFAHRGILSQTLSRKIVHVGTGPLFVLCWPLFPALPAARFLAALVPFVLTLGFFLVGMGWVDNPELVKSTTRNGDRQELLQGPLYYGLMFIVCTIIFWRHSPVGILALMMMCGGDGLADIVGRRFGTHKLPLNPHKSWAGSAAMLLGSFLFGFGYVGLFNSLGMFQPALTLGPAMVKVAGIAIAATLVEALPVQEVDNITITLTVVGLGSLML
ncbi:MAG: diacylglycerol/polyprenol kinase family protein [Elainellaceae cyanobacterium]